MAQTPTTDAMFRSMVNATIEDVRRYCTRRLRVADVNDAVSEVYLVAWRRRNKLPAGSDVLPWLYGIARNVVRNVERSNRRTSRLRARMAVEPVAVVESVELQVVRREADAALLDAIGQLSEADQEVIKLRAWERLTAVEIGEVVGCSASAAQKRVARAVGRLEKAYQGTEPEAATRSNPQGGAS